LNENLGVIKKIRVFIVAFLLILCIFNCILSPSSAVKLSKSVIDNDDSSQNTYKASSLDNTVPIWDVGHEWIYSFNFEYKFAGAITIDGQVNNLKIKVIEIDENANEYILRLTGKMTGSLTLLGFLPGGSFDVDIDGNVYIKIHSLALKSADFEPDGSFLLCPASGDVELVFDPVFDIFDFPILPEEDASYPWNAGTHGTINGFFEVIILFIPYKWPFRGSRSFSSQKFHLVNVEDRTVNAGTYNCFKIRGNLGPSHGGKSNIWYSPDAGYFVEMDEKICDWNGVDLTIKMKLKSTNYEPSSNSPPNEPSNPIPGDQTSDVYLNADLRWDGGDPDSGDTVKYNVYFGTDRTPDSGELVSELQTSTDYELDALEEYTTYYWKIVAFDKEGESTEGDVWEFTTGEDDTNTPPSTPVITGPTNVKAPGVYEYDVVSVDDDNDLIYYVLILKRNGATAGGVYGAGASGNTVKAKVPFILEGNYQILVKATDNISGVSDWGTLSVAAPKEKTVKLMFSQFLDRLLDKFSLLKQILDILKV
jgi:hypothetical protein